MQVLLNKNKLSPIKKTTKEFKKIYNGPCNN